MGLCASQARLLMIVAYKSDLEFRMQQICQKRMVLAKQTEAAYNLQSKDTSTVNTANDAILNSLQSIDKQLEMEGKNVETQHTAIQTEYESVQKIIQKNIEMSFKYMANA